MLGDYLCQEVIDCLAVSLSVRPDQPCLILWVETTPSEIVVWRQKSNTHEAILHALVLKEFRLSKYSSGSTFEIKTHRKIDERLAAVAVEQDLKLHKIFRRHSQPRKLH